jgi:xylan 1,4-beta-xylosidase
MFGKMAGDRVAVRSSADIGVDTLLKEGVRGASPDVHALASLGPKRVAVMAWHYHDDDLPGPAAAVEMTITGLPDAAATGATLRHYRIDRDHSNAHTAWVAMGSPQKPTPEQYAKLEQAGQLATLGEATSLKAENGSAVVRFTLPRQGVSLLVIEWK